MWLEDEMLRRGRAVVAAVFVLFAGVPAAQAATIGYFSLVDLGFEFTIDVANVTTDLQFSDLDVTFCDGSVRPADLGEPGFLDARGQLMTCDGGLTDGSSLGSFDPGSIGGGGGSQFVVNSNAFLPSTGFAFLIMTVTDPQARVLPFYVDPLSLGCDPTSSDCSNVISTVPVPEPVTLLLLAGGLAAIAARRARRRS